MKPFRLMANSALFALLTGLASCGGGGGGQVAGIGGTGRIASGTITQFGSIFVNGVEYTVKNATCLVDDVDVSGQCNIDNLSVGMVVTVTGTVSGTQGTADKVVFAGDIEGPVTNLLPVLTNPAKKTFDILGMTVVIDSTPTTTTFKPPLTFTTLANNNVVEVSGFVDDKGVLQATYIEKKSDIPAPGTTIVKLSGIASTVGGSVGKGDNFDLNGITVSIAANADLTKIPGGRVNNGDLVEVRGTFTGATSLLATRVEPEDKTIGNDGDAVSIEGLISNFTGQSSFKVAGQAVDATNAILEPTNLQLSKDLQVEVEGTLTNGILIADKVSASD